MKLKEMRKRFTVLGTAAMIAMSGSTMYALAAPEGSTDGQEMKIITVDDLGNHGAGGVTPTVFADSYRAPKTKRYSRVIYPPKYDLRELGQSTTVKNQGVWGTCWAFATIASLESCQLKNEGAKGITEAQTPDFSELQLGWFNYEPQSEISLAGSAAGTAQAGEGVSMGIGSKRLEAGGNMPQATTLLATWQGAADEKDIPYQNAEGGTGKDGNWAVDDSKRNLSAIHLQNADFMPSPTTLTGGEYVYDKEAEKSIKDAIINNGAVAISYYADQSMQGVQGNGDYFNYTNWCQYVDVLESKTTPNHTVTIVGWDDTYARTNFRQDRQPEEDGAWLVKNSWGTGYWGVDNSGYFWLSYHDRTISQVTSYQGEASDNYDNNYQYDYLGLASAIQYSPGTSKISIANVFTANGSEELKAVSAITLAPETTVTVKVYHLSADAKGPLPKDGEEPVATVTKKFTYSGYHTIEINAQIQLAAGDKFSVVETIKDSEGKYYYPVEIGADHSGNTTQKAICNPGESYWVYSNNTHKDMSSANVGEGSTCGNVMIKAFTDNVPFVIPKLSEITYSPAQTLADIELPAATGGSWSWDLPDMVPTADKAAYPATFTPLNENSFDGVYHTDISLKVNKAVPQITDVSASPIIYGQNLSEAVLDGNAMIDGVPVKGTLSWIFDETYPQVCDSEKTAYDFRFIPEDQINCNAANGQATVKIGKKSVTVAVKDAAKSYGNENPKFELEAISQGTLVGNDTEEDLRVLLTCQADEKTPVGNTDITGISGAENYEVTVVPGTLAVQPRTADFRVLDASIRYGESLPDSYAFEVLNLAYWDSEETLGAELSITPKNIPDGNPSGIYELGIDQAVIANENYVVGQLVSGKLTIREAAAPPIPELNEITYHPDRTLKDLVFPETEGGSWAWDEPDETPTVNKKAYAATFTPEEGSQYGISQENIPLRVNKAVPEAVDVTSGAITYGEALSESKLTVYCQADGSKVPGEAFWQKTDEYPKVEDSENVSFAYRFTPTDQENYETIAGQMIVTVKPKKVEAQVKNASKVYGDANPEFGLEFPASQLVSGDTEADLAIRLSCNADQRTPSGSIPIQGASESLNYDVTIIPGILAIQKRPVNFKVTNMSIKYDEALPDAYNFQVSNLVNGDDKASIKASASIEAVDMPVSKTAGTYQLKIKNASVGDPNYTVGSTTDGTLMIQAAKQEAEPGKIVASIAVQVSAKTLKYKTIKLSWNQVSEADGYQVQLKSSGKWKTIKTIGKNSMVSYTYTKTKLGKAYTFRVRAFCKANGKTIYSKAGQVKQKAVPQAPARLKAAAKRGKTTLNWKKVPGISGYAISRKTGRAWKTVGNVKASQKSFIDKRVKRGKTYTYRIRAYKVSKGKKVYGSYSAAVKVKASR